jgi:hypothetical protein
VLWLPGRSIRSRRQLATISEKYHTPIVAITAPIVNLIFMALFVFTPWFSNRDLIEAAVRLVGGTRRGDVLPYCAAAL